MQEALSKDDVALLVNLIRQFRIAMSNMRLYPTESEVVQASLKSVYDSLTTFLAKHKYLTLGFVEGKPIVNKIDISKGLPESIKPGVFLERLNEHNIKTITFRLGLRYEDLVNFMELLKEKYDPEHTLRDKLKERGINKIGVNEKIYTTIGDKDLVIERGEEILARSKGALEQILEQVEKIVDMTLNVQDPSERERLKLEIGKRLLFKDPQLLEKLLKEMKIGGGEKQEGAPSLDVLTTEELENHLGELIETYKLQRRGKYDEVLERLKELIRETLEILEKFDPSYTISQSLIENIDVIEDFYERWEKMAAGSMTSEEEKIARKILQESSFSLLSEPRLAEVVENLSSKGLWKYASKIVARILLALDSPNPGTRAKALRKFNEIKDVVFMNASAKEFYAVYMKLLSVFFKETFGEALDEFLNLLPAITEKAFERGLKNEVIKLLSFINMEISSRKTSRERREVMMKLREAIARNLKPHILARISKGGDLDPFTLKIIYNLREAMVTELVDIFKNTDDETVAFRIGKILESMGSIAEATILSEISVTQDKEKLKRLLSIVDKFKNKEEVLNTLELTLKSVPSHIKPLIFEKMISLGSGKLENYAFEFLESDDPDVQLLGYEYLLKYTPDKVRDRVEKLLLPKKVLFLKFQQPAYIKVKKRIIELIGERKLLWGIPMVIPQLDHPDRTIKKAAYEALFKFKPEILRNFKKELKKVSKSKDPLTRDFVKKLESYMEEK